MAEEWARENKTGHLVTEVGFLGKKTEHFIRAKGPDPFDEETAFKVWNDIIDVKDGPFEDIALEPGFGSKYYQELRDYMLKGTDLNPYIYEKVRGELDLPRNSKGQIQLNRVLSYKIDEEILESLGGHKETIFNKRGAVLRIAVNKLRDQGNKAIELIFGLDFMKLVDVGRAVSSYFTNNVSYPFLSQGLQEGALNSGISSASFIKNHPATLYNRADGDFIIVPYVDKEYNFPAQLFRRFNAFLDCIEKQTDCNNIEEKRAYTNLFLAFYKEMKDKQEKGDSEEKVDEH